MYNLDNIVRMYFADVCIQRILDKAIKYNEFPQEEFSLLSMSHFPQYSDTENRQLYHYIKEGTREEGHPFAGMAGRSGLNVFAALEELAEQLLIMENNEVLCMYSKLLRFREISRFVGEDLLVCAYLAVRFRRFGEKHSDFSWNVAIGHNNAQLSRIMERGISENHFHLYGSAPTFDLLWIHFMNYVTDDEILKKAKKVQQQQRMARIHYSVQYSEDPFAVKILKAALIRAHIVSYLFEMNGQGEEYDIEELLDSKEALLEYCFEIQKTIDRLKDYAYLAGVSENADYALRNVENLRNATTEQYWFAGERWMMYKMLKGELNGKAAKDGGEKYYQWFYAYLVIKQSVRSEFVQVNDAVGFENFAIYNERKKGYIDERKMIETAIYGSMESGNIRTLEIRITPDSSVRGNAKRIWEIDSVIWRDGNGIPRSNYYYVFHFTKTKDDPLEQWEDFEEYRCRHYKRRLELEKQADAICTFRDHYRKEASEVLGIDACSQEIGCRPEVFAPIFRQLSEHVVERVVGLELIDVGQLKKTFHVGEDFLDVVDGLRAIDEAIRFLNLQCGDRIGHGTVLGIDAGQWYSFKQNTLLLAQQDYLDNIVWLYHKLVEYDIDEAGNLKEWLLNEFEFYFAEIYLRLYDGSSRDAQTTSHVNIHTYYEAWKLRGDDPSLYQKKEYGGEVMEGREWLVNRRYPERFENRVRKEIGYLYYLYHYDWDVRKSGEKVIQVYVPQIYVEGAVAAQKAMQKEFATMGIGIETNPSSNLAISTISSYDKHPIVTMYNKDLTWDVERMKECPQINVSINTDDKGIFHTRLENEYALVACAMEKAKDEKGNFLYNRQMIYQWLDNIREMGNMQSFLQT